MDIVKKKISELKEYANNPRINDDAVAFDFCALDGIQPMEGEGVGAVFEPVFPA